MAKCANCGYGRFQHHVIDQRCPDKPGVWKSQTYTPVYYNQENIYPNRSTATIRMTPQKTEHSKWTNN